MIGFTCMLLVLPVIGLAADTPWDVVQQYYEADKNEDIDTLMSLTDFSHVDAGDLDQFKADMRTSLETLAELFDTKSYTLSNENVNINGNDAFVFYHQNSLLEDSDGQTAEVDLDFVAVMYNVNGEWKITYTQPKDTFEQNFALRELTVSAGEDFADYEISGAASNGTTDTPEPSSGEGGDIIMYAVILVIVILAGAGYFFLR